MKIINNELHLYNHQGCHLHLYLLFLAEVQVVVTHQVHQEG